MSGGDDFYYNKELILGLINDILPQEKISTQEKIQNLNEEESTAFFLAVQLRTLEMSYQNTTCLLKLYIVRNVQFPTKGQE